MQTSSADGYVVSVLGPRCDWIVCHTPVLGSTRSGINTLGSGKLSGQSFGDSRPAPQSDVKRWQHTLLKCVPQGEW